MEFQQFFDPFGSALSYAGQRLQNEGKAIQNQVGLLDLGLKKQQLEDLKASDAISREAFASYEKAQQGAFALLGVEGGKPTAGSTGEASGSDTTPPTNPYASIKADYSRQYQLNQGLARAAAAKHDMVGVEKFTKDATENLKGYQEALGKEVDANNTRMTDLSRVFTTGAESPEAFVDAMRAMKQLHPEWDPRSLIKEFGFRDAGGGSPAYDKKKIDNLAHMALAIKDKMTLEHQKAEEMIQKETNKIRAWQATVSARRADIAAVTAHEMQLSRTDKRREAFVSAEKKSLEKEPVNKNWDKYEDAMSRAITSKELLESKGGYQAFTTSDAATLVRSAQAMMQDFRSRYSSGVHDMQNMTKLNGMVRNMEKWATTIGEGEKQLAFDTAKEMVSTMQGIYDHRNVQVTRETLKRVDSLVKKGIDPSQLDDVAKGDLKDLIGKGLAKQETKDGKVYVLIQNPVTRKFTERYMIEDLNTKGEGE